MSPRAPTPEPDPPPTPRPSRREVLGIGLAAFLLAFLGSLWLHAGSTLYDTDSYYHLAVARAYAQGGSLEAAPGLRFSVLADGFGDKEWLFHRLLAPLATLTGTEPEDAVFGGRLALALLTALIAALVATLAARPLAAAEGSSRWRPWWAVGVPFFLVFVSTELAWRLVRLRPELLALSLFLAALWALGRDRPRLLGVVALLFTLSYTAFHALAGLVVLAFLLLGWKEREWPWRCLAYAALGTGLGLVLHPQFPHNLEVWAVQNLQFFRFKDVLAVGTEIRPNTTDITLLVNVGLWLGLGALWRSGVPGPPPSASDRRTADVFALATLVFGGLYLLMSRFSIYFLPVLTLWVLWELRRRGRRVGARVRLTGRGHLPLALVLGLCLLVSVPEARRQLATYQARTSPGPERVRLTDRQGFADALPDGARVAADWGSTATYLLWAPQGRYLNALDPVFLAVPHPRRHAALAAVLDGVEPDVPLTLVTELDSEFLAFSTLKQPEAFQARLPADPRLVPLYRGYHALYRVQAPEDEPFLLDWTAVPAGTPLPVPVDQPAEGWLPYPRLAESSAASSGSANPSSANPSSANPSSANFEARALEGWLDGDRVLGGRGDCLALMTDWRPPEGETGGRALWELAPYGPTSLWVDGELAVRVDGDLGSVLGRGVALRQPAGPGPHRVTVLTCRAGEGAPAAEPGRVGFYLVRRPAEP